MPLGRGPDRAEGRHVGDDGSEPILAVLGDQVIADRREPVRVAADEDQPRAEGGEGARRDPPQAGRGARDEDRPTSKRALLWRRPREDAPPDHVPDSRKAGDDGDLEGVVDQLLDGHGGDAVIGPGRTTDAPPVHALFNAVGEMYA